MDTNENKNSTATAPQSLTGLIDQAQLKEIVSEIVSLYNGKIAALEARIKTLEDTNMLILAENEQDAEGSEELTP